MTVVQCPACAARYRVPEKLLGKRAKCKKCGEPFTLAAPPPAQDEDLLGALATGDAVAPSAAPAPPSAAPPKPTATPPALPGRQWSPVSAGPVEEPAPTGFSYYFRDVGRSLLFFRRGGDLATYIMVVILVSLQIPLAFAPCFGPIGVLIIQGWYMAFQLNVVVGAAGGEQNLPNLGLGAIWEGIILPLLKFLAAELTALLPFLIGLVYLLLFGQLTGTEALGHIGAALTNDYVTAFDTTQGGGPLLGAIMIIPLLIWPMMVLVVAVGGIAALIRLDLITITICRTLPVYILVAILAIAGVVGPALLSAGVLLLVAEGREGTDLFIVTLVVGALFGLLGVYANIFVMRVIGLYYHHFKQRFAWSWG